MSISDWSSDVCSSVLHRDRRFRHVRHVRDHTIAGQHAKCAQLCRKDANLGTEFTPAHPGERPGLGLVMEDHCVGRDRFMAQQMLGVIDKSEEHPSELQSLMRISYAVFCLKKTKTLTHTEPT